MTHIILRFLGYVCDRIGGWCFGVQLVGNGNCGLLCCRRVSLLVRAKGRSRSFTPLKKAAPLWMTLGGLVGGNERVVLSRVSATPTTKTCRWGPRLNSRPGTPSWWCSQKSLKVFRDAGEEQIQILHSAEETAPLRMTTVGWAVAGRDGATNPWVFVLGIRGMGRCCGLTGRGWGWACRSGRRGSWRCGGRPSPRR